MSFHDVVIKGVFHIGAMVGVADQPFGDGFVLGEKQFGRSFGIKIAVPKGQMGDGHDRTGFIMGDLEKGRAGEPFAAGGIVEKPEEW